jgi:aryl-alcohol dehydrogenase-like predicted oxidoreductase
MQRRRCKSTGLELPVIGVGVWSFGGGSYWGEQDQGEVNRVVTRAIDLGCNFFDTAEAYNDGRSEESLGKALEGRRREALIASKILPIHCHPEGIVRHCEASLRRLNTDYLDLYLIHWPLNPLSLRQYKPEPGAPASPPRIEEALRALEELRAAGKVRHVGISNFGATQLEEVRATGVAVACDQLPYSLVSRAIEHAVLPACEESGIGIIAYMPLMQGLLTGRFSSADAMPAIRTRTRQFRGDRAGSRHGEPGFEAQTFAAVRSIAGICKGAGIPMEQAALGWCLSRQGITSAIAGARSVAQLEANARAGQAPLPAEIVAALDAATEELRLAMGPSVDLFESAAGSRTL